MPSFPKKIKKKKTDYEKACEWRERQRENAIENVKKKRVRDKDKNVQKIRTRKKKQRKRMVSKLSAGYKYRIAVRERDKNICQMCCKKFTDEEVKAGRLHVHHVKGRSKKYEYNVRYGVCLCGRCTFGKCHDKAHENQKKWRPILLKKLDEIYKEITNVRVSTENK